MQCRREPRGVPAAPPPPPPPARQASAEIRRLRSAQRGRDAGIDRQAERRERRAVQRDLQQRADDATRVDLEREVSGYGANATWR